MSTPYDHNDIIFLSAYGFWPITLIDVGLTLHVTEHTSTAHETPSTLPHIEGSVMSVECE